MDLTLPLKRKEVIKVEPPISQMLQFWPALFVEMSACESECVDLYGNYAILPMSVAD